MAGPYPALHEAVQRQRSYNAVGQTPEEGARPNPIDLDSSFDMGLFSVL
jgi:hypothetical protein